MTTAISSPDRFGSLLRGLLRKNIPNMVYLALIGFVGIPLPYLLAMFRRWEDQGEWVLEVIKTADRGGLYQGIAVGAVCLLWLVGSFILALSGVGYMHDRRAVDLYHSLPVTRGQLLLGHALANFITIALPMTANTLLTAILAAVRHGMAPTRAVFAPGAIVMDLLGWYITAFAIIVMVYLAATQVGSVFDTFLFSGVYLATAPVLCFVHLVMCRSFLLGWCYDIEWKVFCTLTPALTMIGSYSDYGKWLYGAMILWLVLGILMLWAAIRLYSRRPSERAESRSCRGLAAGIFRFVATFVGGLGFGVLFGTITGVDGKAASLGWTAVFALAVYFLVELILGRGFKGMKKKSVLMGVGMTVITVLYAGIIFSGGLGFEDRVPAAEQVVGASINYRGRYNEVTLYDAEGRHTRQAEGRSGEYYYDMVQETRLRGQESIKAVTAVHKLLSGGAGKALPDGSDGFMGRLEITYTYADGREMKRRYCAYGEEELLAALTALEDTGEFQSRVNPLYYWTAEKNPYERIDLCDPTGLNTQELTKPEYDTAALVAALRQDILAEKAEDYYRPDRETVCYLYLQSNLVEQYSRIPAEKDFYDSFTVTVGRHYTHTIDLLTEWGLEEYLTSADYDAAAVSVWACDVQVSGRIMLPLWRGADDRNFNAEAEDYVLLDQPQTAALLQRSTWTYSTLADGDYLYMTFVKKMPDGGLRFGLSVFLPTGDAAKEPALRDFIAEYYGYNGGKWSYPETASEDRLIVQ